MKTLKIYPIGNYVAIIRAAEETDRRTAGGIVIPDTSKEFAITAMGIVFRLGPAVNDGIAEHESLYLREGDKVVFNPWPHKGATLTLDQGLSACVLVPRDEIYAKYETVEATEEDIRKMNELRDFHGRTRIETPDQTAALGLADEENNA